MESKVKFRRSFMNHCKIIGPLVLLLPITAYAHMISITATKPFPATVVATSNSSATFTVTNIASRANVTVIDQSRFPSGSGLSISSSTCGSLLRPRQTCTIHVSLQAPATGQTISAALKEWAKPTADGVQYPITIKVTPPPDLPLITVVPVNSSQLQAFRDPVVAEDSGNWLIVSGSTGNFHNFNNGFNTAIYVYNPSTSQIHSVSIINGNTDLDPEVLKQLASSSPQFLQDGDTLYIIGGFYTADNLTWTTINNITSINVPGMINAVIQGSTSLNQYVNFRTDIPQFKVTGGQLGKINNYFYLAFGQDCDGASYCTTQTYTNSIYQFITDPTLLSTSIVNTVIHQDLDGSGWRRRDYTLAPFIQGNAETLFAMAGPFTPGNDALVWTNGITFNSAIQSNDNFINQQANQYSTSHLSMYSASSRTSYVATFSGLSNLYWSTNGLIYDNSSPYGNILDLISSDASGMVQEYANFQPMCSGLPLESCLYMGLGAEFIPVSNYFDSRSILQLDQLPKNTKTLVGYIYAGLVSTSQDIFSLPPPPNPPNPPSPSYVTNQVYAVYVVPSGPSGTSWKNITNLFPGN